MRESPGSSPLCLSPTGGEKKKGMFYGILSAVGGTACGSGTYAVPSAVGFLLNLLTRKLLTTKNRQRYNDEKRKMR